MNDPRRWIDEGDASLEGALFRAGRAEAAPAAAKARTLAALGLAEGSAAPARAQGALPAGMPRAAANAARARARRRADAAPGEAMFRGVLGAEGRSAGGWAAAAALAAAAAIALLAPGLRPSAPAGSVEVNLREAGPHIPAETAPVRLSVRDPVYTPEALAARAEGDVQVKCTVTVEGRLADCTILRSVPFMDQAVLEALAGWRFSPATRHGRAVAVEQVFTVRLTLPR